MQSEHYLVTEEPKKKRKIRKGTTSCWECKKRKTRCQFASSSNDACIGCERRGTACVTQEYDDANTDQGTGVKRRETEERLQRAEDLLEKMVHAASRWTPTAVHLTSEPRSTTSATLPERQQTRADQSTPPSRSPSAFSSIAVFDSTLVHEGGPVEFYQQTSVPTSGRGYEDLAQRLHSALPSQHDANLIISAGYTAAFVQFFTLSYRDLFSGNLRSAAAVSALPSPSSHPILLARTLLYLANGLQHLHPSTPNARQLELGRSTLTTSIEYLELASLATKEDDLVDSLEGLECLILETVYHINAGNLRRAWLILKRATGLGQLMGLHQRRPANLVILDPATKASPSVMWHRIVGQDRYIALMMGLPSATATSSIPKTVTLAPDDSPTDHLERLHCNLMGCITVRNGGDDVIGDFVTTQEIDKVFQKAAQSMPSDWWLLPSSKPRHASSVSDDSKSLEDVLRTLSQITHFDLLILLHLPYMLRSFSDNSYDYSRAASVNASRELLCRYIKFRCMNHIAFRCRSIDFSSFIACLTLLIAHLERCHRKTEVADFLAHQRFSDRAMVEEAVDLMMEVNDASSDSLLEHIASMLRSLLEIERDAAICMGNSAGSAPEVLGPESSHRHLLRLKVPHYGTVNITRNGISSTHRPDPESPSRSRQSRDLHGVDPGMGWDTAGQLQSYFSEPLVGSYANMTVFEGPQAGFQPDIAAEAEYWAIRGADGTFSGQMPGLGGADGNFENAGF